MLFFARTKVVLLHQAQDPSWKMCICLMGCFILGVVMATVTLVLGWTLGWKSGRKATEKKLLKTAYEQAEKERDLWEDQEEPGCMRTCSGKNLVHEGSTWKMKRRSGMPTSLKKALRCTSQEDAED